MAAGVWGDGQQALEKMGGSIFLEGETLQDCAHGILKDTHAIHRKRCGKKRLQVAIISPCQGAGGGQKRDAPACWCPSHGFDAAGWEQSWVSCLEEDAGQRERARGLCPGCSGRGLVLCSEEVSRCFIPPALGGPLVCLKKEMQLGPLLTSAERAAGWGWAWSVGLGPRLCSEGSLGGLAQKLKLWRKRSMCRVGEVGCCFFEKH